MAFLFVLFISFLLGWSMPYLLSSIGKRRWKQEGRLLIEQALIERQRLMQETEILINEKKKQCSTEMEHVHVDVNKRQKNLGEKEASLKRKEETLDSLALRLEEKRKKADQRLVEQNDLQVALETALLEASQLSKEEALSSYMNTLQESQKEAFETYKNEIVQDLVAEERAKIASCFEEVLHAGYNLITTHSHFLMLPLPHDTSIPRIIGSNGKNIEGLSTLLGCDLWVDDEKKELVLSSYDDQKRFIAERVLRELIAKDLYSLAQAAATKEKVESTLEQEFILKGKEALHEVRLTKNYPDAVLSLLGKLDLRSSHGQNVLLHCIETAQMAKIVAQELQLSPDLAGAIGLFHDIGKMLDHSWGERHPARGKAFLEHHHIDSKICEGVGSHHMLSGHTSLEAMLIPYLDALSARGCAKRLVQQSMSFKQLRQQLEKLPAVASASCIDAQTKIQLLLRLRDKTISQTDVEAILTEENVHLPVEIRLFSATSQPLQTFLFLPKNHIR